MEKSCEGCGAASAPHALRHTLRRLPRVLVLHMKRFKVGGWVWVRAAGWGACLSAAEPLPKARLLTTCTDWPSPLPAPHSLARRRWRGARSSRRPCARSCTRGWTCGRA